MTPSSRIEAGLADVASAIADLRIEQEELLYRLAGNHAVLVNAEQRAVALRFAALRSRGLRHLAPGERSRPAPPIADLAGAGPADDRTARSLAIYCPTGATRAALPMPAKRGILSRLLAPFDPR